MLAPMTDEYLKEHVQRVRALAERADPFIKKRLLDLAERYDEKLGKPSRAIRALQLADSTTARGPDQRNC
jgi:hypothetical protein